MEGAAVLSSPAQTALGQTALARANAVRSQPGGPAICGPARVTDLPVLRHSTAAPDLQMEQALPPSQAVAIVWGGHSCPPPLKLVLVLGLGLRVQNQGQGQGQSQRQDQDQNQDQTK